MDKLQTSLLRTIQLLINNNSDNLKYDYTINGKVVAINSDTVTVEINGETTSCKIKNGEVVSVGDVVLLTIPQNNFNDMYVSGKLGTASENGTATDHNHNDIYYTKSEIDSISKGATKTEASTINGNIKIDGVEKIVYTHPTGTNPHGTTKSDIGLDNVENKSSATIRSEITSNDIDTGLGYIPEDSSKKNVANGYAGLDSNIKIPLSLLPDMSMNKTHVVSSIEERNALTNIKTADRVYVLSSTDGSREGFIWDGTQWLKDSDTDWANVNFDWININGKPNSTVVDIDDAVSKKHSHSNLTIIEKVTQTLIDNWNSAFSHISDTVKHITSSERSLWNTVSNKVDKISGKGLSTEDYTTGEKTKLSGIEVNANKYVLPVATDATLGGIKVGSNLSVSSDGVLSANSNPDNYIVREEIFVTSSNQTVFNLTKGNYIPNKNMVDVYVYGQKQPKDLFEETSSTVVTAKLPFEEGIRVIVKYIQSINATPYPTHANEHLTEGVDPIPKVSTSFDGLMAKEDKNKLDGIEVGANKYTHPSTHSADIIVDGITNKAYTSSEKIKLAGIEGGAEVNNISDVNATDLTDGGDTTLHYHSSDRNRSNHTGTQLASTISDFASTVRTTTLTGLLTTTNAVIGVADSVISALGKLQKQISDNLVSLNNHTGNKNNPHGITKAQVGLGNVDNTSDIDKPISTATQSALNLKTDKSQIGVANGIAQLDANGIVPSSQLPSYVDDVLEYSSSTNFPLNGESGKIYVDTTTNLTYRWSGTVYIEISKSLALGETSSTAYAGDKGATTTSNVNNHIANKSNPHNVTKSQIGLGNVPNVDTSTTVNVADSTNKRFVTDAQKAVLENTSGTNTGDETVSSIKSKLGITTLSGINTGDQDLSGLVPKVTTINGHALSGNVAVTKSDVGLGSVENKSSATIRGEITSGNVTTALGYTPTKKYSIDIGNGSATEFPVNHNLDTKDINVDVEEVSTGELVMTDIIKIDANNIKFLFATAPTSGQFRVTITG